MQEHEAPEPHDDAADTAAQVEPVAADEGDATLDGFEADLASVESALDALDADDLDGAEALAGGLGRDAGEPVAPTDDA